MGNLFNFSSIFRQQCKCHAVRCTYQTWFKPHWVQVELYTMLHRLGKKPIKCKTKPLPYQNPFPQTF